MSEQRFVLVAWPPTKEMVDVGRRSFWCDPAETDLNDGVRAAWREMCAASPVAADDPAMVERVERAICQADERNGGPPWDHPVMKSKAAREMARDRALEVLRLFSPPKE